MLKWSSMRVEDWGRPEVWSSAYEPFRAFAGGTIITSLVIFKVDHIGDFSLALDALFCLREAFQQARITLVCAPWNVKTAESLQVADEVVPLPYFESRADAPFQIPEPAALGQLRRTAFDLAIDLRVDPDTRWLLDHIDAAFRCGFESDLCVKPMTFALSRPNTAAQNDLVNHQSMLMLRLAQAVRDFFQPRHRISDIVQSRLAAAVPDGLLAGIPRPLVSVNTSSGRVAKNWLYPRFTELVRWLSDTIGTGVVLLGTADQQAESDAIAAKCAGGTVLSLAGRTDLHQAIGVIAAADMFIGNDTSLTHYAARLGIPTIAIFSGIDPTASWSPVGNDVTIIRSRVPCSPCHILHIEDCQHAHTCVQSIEVDFVKSVVRCKLLELTTRAQTRPNSHLARAS